VGNAVVTDDEDDDEVEVEVFAVVEEGPVPFSPISAARGNKPTVSQAGTVPIGYTISKAELIVTRVSTPKSERNSAKGATALMGGRPARWLSGRVSLPKETDSIGLAGFTTTTVGWDDWLRVGVAVGEILMDVSVKVVVGVGLAVVGVEMPMGVPLNVERTIEMPLEDLVVEFVVDKGYGLKELGEAD
jgi:hypothetical protein